MFEYLAGRTPGIIGNNSYKKYAVTIPLFEVDGQCHVLFEVRAKSLRRQPGEICFPGGKVEAGESYERAALRELSEELQIPQESFERIAPGDVNISPAGQIVAPFLVLLKDYGFTWNPDEVDEVFAVPLQYFWDHAPACYYNEVYTKPADDFPLDKIPGGSRYPWHTGVSEVYFYEVSPNWIWTPGKRGSSGERVIWGLTARIMKSAAELLKGEEGIKG